MFYKKFLSLGAVCSTLMILLCAAVVASCSNSGSDSGASGPTDPGKGSGTVYYVSTSGSDENPGTEAQPWRTIQKAAETLNSGETVYIRSGTYRERVVPQNSGSAYISYAAYPGETATIDGSGIRLPSDWGGLFDISGKSYIQVIGLRIVNVGPSDNHVGILVENSHHIIIKNCAAYNTSSSGIGVWGSRDVILEGNDVELACNGGEQECITLAGTSNFEIRNNHVHHSGSGTKGGEGIDVKDGSSRGKVYGNHVHDLRRLGIYVDAWDKHTFDIEVFQNRVHDCASDGFVVASEAGGVLEDVWIYNNLAYNNKSSGLTVAGWGDGTPGPLRNIRVMNNTFYRNGNSSWGGGISVESPQVSGLIIRNNIFSQNVFFQIQVETAVKNLQIDHNLIDGYRGYEAETSGSESVEGNPLFENVSGANFRLREGSPAIDAGSSTEAPRHDFDGVSRPQRNSYDIGAFERM